MSSPLLTRRAALTGLALAAAGGAADAAHAAPDTVTANPDRGAASADLERFIRMRTAADGSAVMWSHAGVVIGKPEGEMALPLVALHGVSFTRARRRAAGVYEWNLDEVGYYCDLRSGEVLETWKNPFTGAQVRPAHYRSPEDLVYAGVAIAARDALPPGVEMRGSITRLADVAGIAAMTEDLYMRLPARQAAGTKPARSLRTLASLGTFTALAAELDGPGRGWVDCQLSYATMNSFAGWLGMDDVPGIQNMRLAGRKCRIEDRAAVPDWLWARIAHDHPSFLEVPARWRAEA